MPTHSDSGYGGVTARKSRVRPETANDPAIFIGRPTLVQPGHLGRAAISLPGQVYAACLAPIQQRGTCDHWV